MPDLLSMLSPQNRRLFKLNTFGSGDEGDMLLEHFSGSEGLSRLFELELALLSQRPDVKLKSFIGRRATIEIELADGSIRYVNGYINRLSSQGSDGGDVAL